MTATSETHDHVETLQREFRRALNWAQTFAAFASGLIANWLFTLERPLPTTPILVLTATVALAAAFSFQAFQHWVRIRRALRSLGPKPYSPAQVFSLNASIVPWQGSRRPVVLVTGYFDLLHAGHITFLQACKRSPHELLVVGVHSDAIAKQEKGPQRPIIHLKHRIEAMRGIGVVDYVFEATCFYDAPPYLLLERINPTAVVLSTHPDESDTKMKLRTFISRYAEQHRIELRNVAVREPILGTTEIVSRFRERAQLGGASPEGEAAG